MSDNNPSEQMVSIPMKSGEPLRVDSAHAIRWLTELYEHYSDRERDLHRETYHGDGLFSESSEREWIRYQAEAGALAFAIKQLSGELPAWLPTL